MVRGLTGLLTCVWLFGAATAGERLAPRAFAEHCAQTLRQALPAVTITLATDLELTIEHPTGRTVTVFLGNACQDYVREPAGSRRSPRPRSPRAA